jgi:hypothetical protein
MIGHCRKTRSGRQLVPNDAYGQGRGMQVPNFSGQCFSLGVRILKGENRSVKSLSASCSRITTP